VVQQNGDDIKRGRKGAISRPERLQRALYVSDGWVLWQVEHVVH